MDLMPYARKVAVFALVLLVIPGCKIQYTLRKITGRYSGLTRQFSLCYSAILLRCCFLLRLQSFKHPACFAKKKRS